MSMNRIVFFVYRAKCLRRVTTYGTFGQGFGSVSGSARIRINLSCWIRIRTQIADPDPDPGGKKITPKNRKKDRIFIF